MGIPPLPLDAEQTAAVINLLKNDHDENELLLFLLKERVPAGVDDAAYVKAGFLSDLTKGETESPYISKEDAVEILGTMLGGYNIQPLIDCLEIDELADDAAVALSNTLLIFDSFNDIFELSKTNEHAKKVINSWANAEWFTSKEDIPENIKLTVFKVPGEINTDDLSPAPDAWSRPDIPLHALAMLKMPRDGINEPLKTIEDLKKKGNPVVFVGDVVGTEQALQENLQQIQFFGIWEMKFQLYQIKKKEVFVSEARLLPFFIILWKTLEHFLSSVMFQD